MLCLTRNIVYPVNQSPNTKPTLGLLIANKTEYVVLVNQIFSIFLFPCSYYLSYKIFRPSVPFCISLKGNYLLHKVLSEVSLYHIIVLFSHFLAHNNWTDEESEGQKDCDWLPFPQEPRLLRGVSTHPVSLSAHLSTQWDMNAVPRMPPASLTKNTHPILVTKSMFTFQFLSVLLSAVFHSVDYFRFSRSL